MLWLTALNSRCWNKWRVLRSKTGLWQLSKLSCRRHRQPARVELRRIGLLLHLSLQLFSCRRECLVKAGNFNSGQRRSKHALWNCTYSNRKKYQKYRAGGHREGWKFELIDTRDIQKKWHTVLPSSTHDRISWYPALHCTSENLQQMLRDLSCFIETLQALLNPILNCWLMKKLNFLLKLVFPPIWLLLHVLLHY